MGNKWISLAIFFGVLQCVQAQGCSDAGICSIDNSIGLSQQTAKNQIEISTIFGAGQHGTEYISPHFSYTRAFNDEWMASVKITGSMATGSFGKRASIGDAYLITNYKPITTKKVRWRYTAGAKIPFNRANLKINDHPLPMDYQTSLGTFDLLAAVNLNYTNWDFNLSAQLPIININANSYFVEYSASNDFPTTNLFERKPDVLFRSTYTFAINKRLSFSPNALFLYHLGKDSYENIYGKRLSIPGSDGLTINGNMITSLAFKNSSIDLSTAVPFVVRKVRPDGLTRSYTVAIAYKAIF